MLIRTFQKNDIEEVKEFTDRVIGAGYYRHSELDEILRKSVKNGVMTSLVLEDDLGKIRGIRISYPPGGWTKGKGRGLCPDQWTVPFTTVAYFQSLFIDPLLTNAGWGTKLSQASLKILADLGARAVICHSWKESPGDSSGKYLRRLGFALVASHPRYWQDVEYACPRCGKPCLCTADEMIKYL